MDVGAQVVQFVAWLLLILSYWRDTTKRILFLQILSGLFYAVGYLMLGAYSGLIVIILEIVRDLAYYKIHREDLIFYISIPFYLLGCVFTYQTLLDTLPYITSLYDGFILTKKRYVVVVGSFITYIIWIIYDFSCGAYVSALTQCIILASNIVILLYGFSKLLRRNKVVACKCRFVTDEVLDAVGKLDRKYLRSELRWDSEFEEKLLNCGDNDFILIKDEERIVGYVNCLTITDSKYKEIKNSKKYINDFKYKDITDIDKGRNYFDINSIVLRPEYQNKDTNSKIIKAISRYFDNIKSKGYKINGIIGISAIEYEDTVMSKLGMENISSLEDGYIVYEMKEW